MNNLIDFEEPIIHPVDDGDFPTSLSMMPKIFRLTSMQHEMVDAKLMKCTATLYHDRVTMKVIWTTSKPDVRLHKGALVSPRWLGKTTCEEGAIKISRLVLMERPEPWENLFHLVPHNWVKDRELVREAVGLFEELPRPYRFLFNAIFWDGQRFQRYCTVPSTSYDHPAAEHGTLYRAVDVSLLVGQMEKDGEIANAELGILAGLLHDAGKADEYRLSPTGEWTLTSRGRLLGHKVTVIEWITEARARWNLLMPEEDYMALLRALTSSFSAPELSGGQRPAILEAILLTSTRPVLTSI